MLDAPNALETPLTGLKKGQWNKRFRLITESTGFYQALGSHHMAGFVDDGSTLLVTFETVQGIQALSEDAQPLGWEFSRSLGWSHLAVVSDGDTWFRHASVYEFFDQMIDDGFFEEFEQVIFYGAGPCGYAAAAYSVSAPGAKVVAIQPQATLDPRVTEWDPRFPEMRRYSFTDRFGYAPDMLDAANEAFVLYDPREDLDAMHAALFTRPNVTKLRMANMGDALQSQLMAMEILFPLLQAVGEGQFSEAQFADLYRARRNHAPYLRSLVARMDQAERPWMTAMICRNVLARMSAPRIRRRLEALEAAAEAGKITIPPAKAPADPSKDSA